MGRIIGIDLGTTNSVAAYWKRRQPKPIVNSNGSSLTPSIVSLEQGNRYVGQEAKDRRASGSQNIIYSVKRFIGRDYNDPKAQTALDKNLSNEVRKAQNGEVEIKLGDHYYSPVEISAMILEKLKKDAEQELGEEVTHAVITVPAYFSQRQKNATREAGRLAGLTVLRIINEPTAAALAFGVEENITEPEHILVYDLGGGTFDVSILMVSTGNYEVLRIDGDNFLGGDDFDTLIIEDMLRQIKQQSGEDLSKDRVVQNILKAHAETIKIALSREEQSRSVVPGIAKNQRGAPVNLDYSLNRTRFEQMIAEFINSSIDIVKRALDQESLKPGEIDRVLLVGGSTRIPLVRKQLKNLFGDKIQIDVDPMQCVALGAAIQTAIPIEWLCANCNTVNEGMQENCSKCQQPHEKEEEDFPVIVCDACGKPNRQGRLECWSCGVKIGAAILFGDDEPEENANEGMDYIRIGDVTSKYLSVEVLSKSKTENVLEVIVPKGTPFPTHEPCWGELYINRAGQEIIEIPVYESENEDVEKDEWELVGRIINDKIPPGTPLGTPVIVEMNIDGDGIVTVACYLKRMKDETLVIQSLHFGGIGAKDDSNSEILSDLGFYAFYIRYVAEYQPISKYLSSEAITQSIQLADEADKVLESKDEQRAQEILDRLKKHQETLPGQTFSLFRAHWAMEQPQVTATERNQINQTILQMESAGNQGDYDQVNKHLKQLKQSTQVLFDKLPTNLLAKHR